MIPDMQLEIIVCEVLKNSKGMRLIQVYHELVLEIKY